MEPHHRSPPPSPEEQQPLWLTVSYWMVTGGTWLLIFQLIPSIKDLDEIGKMVGMVCAMLMMPFELCFFGAYLNKQHRKKGSRLLKDVVDSGGLFLGLVLQDHVENMTWQAIYLLIAVLAKMLLVFVMAWGFEDFGILDLFLALLTQALVSSYRKKRIDLVILVGVLCMLFTVLRNRFPGICACLYNISGSQRDTASEQSLPTQTQLPVTQSPPQVAGAQSHQHPVAGDRESQVADDRHLQRSGSRVAPPLQRSGSRVASSLQRSGSRVAPPYGESPSRSSGKEM